MSPVSVPFKACTIETLVVGRDYLTYEREPISGSLRNFVMRYAGSTVNKDEFRKAEFIFEIPTEAVLKDFLLTEKLLNALKMRR